MTTSATSPWSLRPIPADTPPGRTAVPATDTSTLYGLLHRAERLHPHRPAVTDHARVITYAELGAAAGRVAAGLRQAGIGPGDRVAILGRRDSRLFVLLHGVLRAGAAVVTLDTAWSAEDRLRRLAAVRAAGVLTTTALPDEEVRALSAAGVRYVEHTDPDVLLAAPFAPPPPDRPTPHDRSAPRVGSDDPAYLSFTSGSGGEPKAVVVTHGNAVHYALALRDRLELTEADAPCVAHLTTLAADLGHTSWLLALATAGRTHVVGDEHARDAPACWAALRDAGCSVMKTTPSHMAELWRDRPDPRHETAPYRPGTLILGGEALPRSLGASLLHDEGVHRLLNHYGPTETTVGAACFLATSAGELPEDEATVPIGTPLGEATLDLLDSSGLPVAEGEPGHLHIGGAASAPGTSAGPRRPHSASSRTEAPVRTAPATSADSVPTGSSSSSAGWTGRPRSAAIWSTPPRSSTSSGRSPASRAAPSSYGTPPPATGCWPPSGPPTARWRSPGCSTPCART